MKIVALVLLSCVCEGFGGVLYHRQHAAAVEASHSLQGNNYDDNHIYGGGQEESGESDGGVIKVIKITRTYAVPVPIPIPFPKEVPIPVAVPKPIPVPVPHPVPYPVHKAVVIPHPVAVPVALPIDHLSPPAKQDSYYQDLQSYSHSSKSGVGYSQPSASGSGYSHSSPSGSGYSHSSPSGPGYSQQDRSLNYGHSYHHYGHGKR